MNKNFRTLKNYSHKVGLNFWHIKFATKYCYKMFGKFKQKNLVEALIRKVATKHKIKIHILKVMPEHIHMLVTLPHNITNSKTLMLLKGRSAYTFFKNHPKSRMRLPKEHLWSAEGCEITVGYNKFATVEKYILNQKVHHATD